MLASASAALMFATKETAFITLGTLAMACISVRIWRWFRSDEPLDRGWFRVVVVAHIVVLLAAFLFRATLIDALKWLNENFLGTSRPPEHFVFYSIIFLVIATLATWVLFLAELRQGNETSIVEPVEITLPNFRSALGGRTDIILLIAAVATVFVYLFILFFSSFFTYADGINKAFEAYNIWTRTGGKEHTQNGNFAYLKWGMKVESPILILSALGALISLLKAKHRLAMFTAFWAFGLFAAYTIIPYKTPWLALSFLLPMCIIAGYGINELIRSKELNLRVAGMVLAVMGTAVLAYQSYELNFVRYDDEEMAYVYAHTRRGFLDLIKKINYYADKSGKGSDATIEIVSPDYWPMTWYVNKYSHANFHGSPVDASTSEMIVAKKDAQDTIAIQKYSAHYKFVNVYPLRPGVDLMLLVRKDLADPDDQELYKITEYPPPDQRHW
jgi:predicted membrane-bound mannosyltransferase